jgi:hypothetical protein
MAETTIREGDQVVALINVFTCTPENQQWHSREAFQATLRNPEVGVYFDELAQIGTPAPVLTEVVSVHRAAQKP